MAKTPETDKKGRPIFLRPANQAALHFGSKQSYYFGNPESSTIGAPKSKNLFIIRFVRNSSTYGAGSSWEKTLSLAVKKMDRPRFQPKIQEMNQYNKKRLVQTGVKYQPVGIDFYDTVGSPVSQMWAAYSAYYYGDMRQLDQSGWDYDITTTGFNDPNNGGFGFSLPPETSERYSAILGSSNFFERIECYQLFGQAYIRYDLINPKIASYDPDDVDYESSAIPTIRMSIEYETVINHNNGQMMPLTSNNSQGGNDIFAILKEAGIDGHQYEPPEKYGTDINNVNIPFYGNATRLLKKLKIPTTAYGVLGKVGMVISKAPQILFPEGTSALKTFGNFSFGSGNSGTRTDSVNTGVNPNQFF